MTLFLFIFKLTSQTYIIRLQSKSIKQIWVLYNYTMYVITVFQVSGYLGHRLISFCMRVT